MKETIRTFREMERERHIKDVFTVLFVTACAVPASQALFGIPVGLFFPAEELSPWLGVLKTAVTLLYRGIALYVPFLLFRMMTLRSPGSHFVRPPQKTAATDAVGGILAACGFGVLAFLAALAFCKTLIADGFVLSDRFLPAVTKDVPATYVAYVLLIMLIPPFFRAVTFRGIALERVEPEHRVCAAVLPALLCALCHISFLVMPVLLVTGIVCDALYLRTKNAWLCYAADGLSSGLCAALWAVSELAPALFDAVLPYAAVAACLLALIGTVLLCRSRAEKKPNGMTGREACRATFGSFALWILLIIFVFRVFLLYVSKPKPEEPSDPIPSEAAETVEVTEGMFF